MLGTSFEHPISVEIHWYFIGKWKFKTRGRQLCKLFPFLTSWWKVNLAMNFIQIYANFYWRHIDINAVTMVFPEFSCQRVFFIKYDFYIATCAISLGVLWKKPHRNWKISWKNIWKIADMGPIHVSKKTSNSLCFFQYFNWPHGQLDSRTLHLA